MIKLDKEEKNKNFTLQYISLKSINQELENNRAIAKKDNREFIIDELEFVSSRYMALKK